MRLALSVCVEREQMICRCGYALAGKWGV